MMNILCFDTSGPHCSAALAVGERIFSHNEILERRHNESLLLILEGLFAAGGIKPTDTDVVGMVTGPGSFTGIRLGAAVTQAIALASGATVVRLPTHEVLYRPLTDPNEADAAVVCSVKSRGELYYVCLYRNGELVEPLQLTDELPAWSVGLDKYTLAGSLPPWWSDTRVAVVADPPDAQIMLALTKEAHDAGLSVPAAHALPEYFAGDSPWRKQTSSVPAR